jgi:hypothetical protein
MKNVGEKGKMWKMWYILYTFREKINYITLMRLFSVSSSRSIIIYDYLPKAFFLFTEFSIF